MLGSTWDAASYTQNITSLAEEGVRLTYMHSHWHCSPTRRSIMSGRIPLHHGEQLSGIATDDIDLRMTYLPAKLAKAGYTSYGTGKGEKKGRDGALTVTNCARRARSGIKLVPGVCTRRPLSLSPQPPQTSSPTAQATRATRA